MSDMYMNNSVFFENFVADVFKGAGYTIQRNVPVKDGVYGGGILTLLLKKMIKYIV